MHFAKFRVCVCVLVFARVCVCWVEWKLMLNNTSVSRLKLSRPVICSWAKTRILTKAQNILWNHSNCLVVHEISSSRPMPSTHTHTQFHLHTYSIEEEKRVTERENKLHAHFLSSVAIEQFAVFVFAVLCCWNSKMGKKNIEFPKKSRATKRSHPQYCKLKIAFPPRCCCRWFCLFGFVFLQALSASLAAVCYCCCSVYFFGFITRLLHCRHWAICYFSLRRVHISVTYTRDHCCECNLIHSIQVSNIILPFLYHQNTPYHFVKHATKRKWK